MLHADYNYYLETFSRLSTYYVMFSLFRRLIWLEFEAEIAEWKDAMVVWSPAPLFVYP